MNMKDAFRFQNKLQTLMAVSYTHLDVYTRQVQKEALIYLSLGIAQSKT